MKVGIIGAMEEEIIELKQHIQNLKIEKVYGVEFIVGQLQQNDIVLVQSGIGKVNATIHVVLLKQLFAVTHIINTGSAGAIDEALDVGDIILAHSLTYHDVDVMGFGYEYGQMAGMPAKYFPNTEMLRLAQQACRLQNIEPFIGLLASGDQFVGQDISKKQIKRQFSDVRAVDMESTAIAQAAFVMGLPFLIIRAVSDSADSQATMSFDQFVLLAGKTSAQIVIDTITLMGEEQGIVS